MKPLHAEALRRAAAASSAGRSARCRARRTPTPTRWSTRRWMDELRLSREPARRHRLRRLPADRRPARAAAPADRGRARRAAVHRRPPVLRAVVQADPARARAGSTPSCAPAARRPRSPRLKRVVAIDRLLLSQLDVLETMGPEGFLEFRDPLAPASAASSRASSATIEAASAGGCSDGVLRRRRGCRDDRDAADRRARRPLPRPRASRVRALRHQVCELLVDHDETIAALALPPHADGGARDRLAARHRRLARRRVPARHRRPALLRRAVGGQGPALAADNAIGARLRHRPPARPARRRRRGPRPAASCAPCWKPSPARSPARWAIATVVDQPLPPGLGRLRGRPRARHRGGARAAAGHDRTAAELGAAARPALRPRRRLLRPARRPRLAPRRQCRPTSPTLGEPRRPAAGIPRTRCSCRCARPPTTLLGIVSVDEPRRRPPPVRGRARGPERDRRPRGASRSSRRRRRRGPPRAARRRAPAGRLGPAHRARAPGRDVLRAVCDGVRDALGFQRVLASLAEDGPRAACARGRRRLVRRRARHAAAAAVGALARLLESGPQREGCVLATRSAPAPCSAPSSASVYASTANGRGRRAWQRHWLLVGLRDAGGRARGHALGRRPRRPAAAVAARLKALRAFANQAVSAIASAEQRDHLLHLAHHDPLTGLRNRRAFEDGIARRLGRWAPTGAWRCSRSTSTTSPRQRRPGARGRRRAAAPLRRPRRRPHARRRRRHAPGRRGVRVVLLDGADARERRPVAERLRRRVRDELAGSRARRHGVRRRGRRRPGRGRRDLVAPRDRALQAAKHLGRDRCVVHDPGTETLAGRPAPRRRPAASRSPRRSCWPRRSTCATRPRRGTRTPSAR